MKLARFSNGSLDFYLSCSLKQLLAWLDTAVQVHSEESQGKDGG